ncbi:MAG TPA: chromosomal replication initiator protein DnaA [Candidatus Wallbacteria bacterium]|nr:MAG: Chromosomal replication initiator protein DnaA [bacterium ADurb.Bin243]HPG57458.1 chromosomal replication initiator protein DnaA [Candidatus Wallbacteria bacterium]
MQSNKDTWRKVVSAVRKNQDDHFVFDGIIIKTREISLQDNVLIVEVESDFIRQKLNEQYMQSFISALCDILKTDQVRIRFLTAEKGSFEDNHDLIDHQQVLKTSKAVKPREDKPDQQAENFTQLTIDQPQETYREDDLEKLQREHEHNIEKRATSGGLFSKYTFDTFVVGKSNQFAHSVSVNVSKFPASKYNPLFIYGGVGLGKTHLMQAIGHHILKTVKKSKVFYVSGDSFLNEMVNSIQNNKMKDFREKFRNADALLVDDIQFIAGRDTTQEEFFHTFNQLFQSKKQIVMTSDRPPQEIKRLEQRLVSRFESGIVVDIQPPDLELRMAILNKARDEANKKISNEMIAYIAQKIEGSIRRLEGAFIKVIAYSENMNREISEALIDEALSDMSQAGPKKITIESVIKIVGDNYRMNAGDFKSKNRSANVAFPRQIAMYLCKCLVDASTTKIGAEFGGRDHSTVIHGISKIEEMMDKDVAFRNEIEKMIQKIKS